MEFESYSCLSPTPTLSLRSQTRLCRLLLFSSLSLPSPAAELKVHKCCLVDSLIEGNGKVCIAQHKYCLYEEPHLLLLFDSFQFMLSYQFFPSPSPSSSSPFLLSRFLNDLPLFYSVIGNEEEKSFSFGFILNHFCCFWCLKSRDWRTEAEA